MYLIEGIIDNDVICIQMFIVMLDGFLHIIWIFHGAIHIILLLVTIILFHHGAVANKRVLRKISRYVLQQFFFLELNIERLIRDVFKDIFRLLVGIFDIVCYQIICHNLTIYLTLIFIISQ